jgi:hypothetical protein
MKKGRHYNNSHLIIIVIDLVKLDNLKENEKVEYYVSMSRARVLLSVVCRDK